MAKPKHTVSEVCKLLPGTDCGLCGNSTCDTTARRIAVGIQQPDACPTLLESDIEDLKEILAEGVETGYCPDAYNEEGIIEIFPCAEEGLVTLEAQLKCSLSVGGEGCSAYDFIHPEVLHATLQNVDLFDRVRYAKDMGYALVELTGKRVHLFKSGKIMIRRADNREDALRTLKLFSRLLWGSIICPSCGSAGVECAGGACSPCATTICPVLLWGPLKDRCSPLETAPTSTIFTRLPQLSYKNIFMDGVSKLDALVELIEQLDGKVQQSALDSIDKASFEAKMSSTLRELNVIATKFTIEEPRKQDAALGLTLRGLGCDLTRILQGYLSLDNDIDLELYAGARKIVFDAYSAFKNGELDKYEVIYAEYKRFMELWDQCANRHTGIIKIAANGLYISRLLGKPIPC